MQQSAGVEHIQQVRSTRKRRSRRFVIALLLMLLLLLLPLIYFSPIGQAWQQSRDMEVLSGDTFAAARFADATEGDEVWLKFLPQEGVLEPVWAIGSKDDGELPEMLALAQKYSQWEFVDLAVSHGSEEELGRCLKQWKRLEDIDLKGDFGNETIPSLADHRSLRFIALQSPRINLRCVGESPPSTRFGEGPDPRHSPE